MKYKKKLIGRNQNNKVNFKKLYKRMAHMNFDVVEVKKEAAGS